MELAMNWQRLMIGLTLCLAASRLGLAEPLALHPENPHYFLWQGQPTILITSGEHYGALLNLDFDYEVYFAALKADGLNHTRTFSGVYREVASSFGLTDNTLAPKPNRFACPWKRSDQPGYADGGNKFDLAQWDPAYFQRLREFMTAARKHGIVVEFTLFCPLYRDVLWDVSPMNQANNVNGIGTCGREEVYALKHDDLTKAQLAFTRKIVGELRDFDNLYYEVCNEPYFGGVTMQWQHRIIDEIVDAERDFPQKHLISLNIANGQQKVEDPHPAVSIFNFHYCVPPDTVAMNYGLNKVIGENETGFRGKADVLYRTEAWDFLIAGGGLFNNLDYSFTAKHPDGTLREYESPGGGSPELRKQLSILKRFMAGFDFIQMKPDNSVISSVKPKVDARALVQQGKAYAVYLHLPIEKKPKDLTPFQRQHEPVSVTLELPPGQYRAEWLNTKDGKIEKSEVIQHDGGQRKLVSPPFVADVALRLRAAVL
jgi:hypothetical protein